MKTLFIIIASIFFGFCMEILSSSINSFLKTKSLKNAVGSISILMTIPYGILIPFVFIPFYKLIYFLPDFIRFIIYGFVFTFIEYLLGFFFYKLLKFVPWDYTEYEDCIGNGYTRTGLWSLWGLAGLWMEYYLNFILYLSNFV